MFSRYLKNTTTALRVYLYSASTHTYKSSNHTTDLSTIMPAHSKISVQDARSWVEKALREFDRSDFVKLDDSLNGVGSDEFIDAFRPTTTPKKKKTPSPKKASPKKALVADLPHDTECCEARADKKDPMSGFRINCQCTNKLPADSHLCPTHTKKVASTKGLELGLYTAEKPTTWADGSPIIWSDSSEEVKSQVKKKVKRKVTCSICGVVGHTKTKCPQAKSDEVLPVPPVDDPVDEVLTVKMEDAPVPVNSEESEEEMAKMLDEETTPPTDEVIAGETTPPTDEVIEGETAPPGFEPEPEPEPVVDPDYDSQKTEDIGGEMTFDCESDTEDENTKWPWDGVDYELDADRVVVYDEDGDHVGNWDGEKIDFLNAGWRKAHTQKKEDALTNEPETHPLESLTWKQLKDIATEKGISAAEIQEAADADERETAIISFIQKQ